MKVAIFNSKKENLYDSIEGRPFSFNTDKFNYTEDYNDADYILCILNFKNPNKDYEENISKSKIFKEFKKKFVFFCMHDSPEFAYKDKESTKFICQPLYNSDINKRYKVIPVPLQMRHYELKLIEDTEFIENIRNNKKIYDFIFVGTINTAKRKELKYFTLPNYKFDVTKKSIFRINDVESRLKIIRKFLEDISKSRFGLSPRGIGTSSFRLYQCLMTGTIPIIYGMQDYPFKDEIDWSDFSFSELSEKQLKDISNKDITQMRKNAINTWEKYFRIPNTDRELFKKYLKI